MPSPFPGLNPYLEQEAVWHDFHERFCPAAAGYEDYIYRGDRRPPLTEDDAEWARQRLREPA